MFNIKKKIMENEKKELLINENDPIYQLLGDVLEDVFERQRKENRTDIEKFLDRDLDDCEVSHEVVEEMVKILKRNLTECYLNEYGGDEKNIDEERIDKLVKKLTNESLDSFEKLKLGSGVGIEALLPDNDGSDSIHESNLIKGYELSNFIRERSEPDPFANIKLTKEEQKKLISNLEKEVEEKRSYIRRLSITLDKYAVLSLYLKSYCNDFIREDLTDKEFINKILNLYTEYK